MNKLRDIGKYRLITNGDFDLCEADVFLLDSLVLIDIRNFYFDGLNPNSASGLHRLLVTMSPNKQVCPDGKNWKIRKMQRNLEKYVVLACSYCAPVLERIRPVFKDWLSRQ